MGLLKGDALAAMCVTGMSPEWAAAEGEGGARGEGANTSSSGRKTA